MRVAIVHDFIREYGGAERVLEVLHEIYPDAPVFTAWCNLDGLGPHKKRFENWDIRTSWAQKIPFFGKLISPLRFLAPFIFESFDFSGYDLVISSSSPYFGKGIITKPPTLHICYCNTPPRFLYGYKTAIDWKKHWWANILASVLNHFLRIYDYWSAQRVDYFIANSREVAARIKKFYRRDAYVIYPPVNIEKLGKIFQNNQVLKSSSSNSNYFLIVSRLVRSKGIALAIEAVGQLGFNLKIVGTGRDAYMLKKLAAKFNQGQTRIEFLGEVTDEELANYYANCLAVIFPAEEEDFGLVPVEGMAAGKPVIAFASGGPLETVIEHVTGEFFTQFTLESLTKVLEHFEPEKYDPQLCRQQARKFSKDRFKQEFKDFVQSKMLARYHFQKQWLVSGDY